MEPVSKAGRQEGEKEERKEERKSEFLLINKTEHTNLVTTANVLSF